MIPYIGGKYKQTEWMDKYKPSQFNSYAEVFGGAMWFYIKSNMKPKKVYYNDIDPLMVNLFTCFKDYENFIKKIKNIPTYNNDIFQHQKKIIQNNVNFSFKDIPNIDFAIAHLYIIVHIFSAFTKDIWRPNLNMVKRRKINSKLMGNNASIKRLKDLNIQQKLDKLIISNDNYDVFIKKIDSSDLFLYVDPPYWNTETHYRHGNFNNEDHLNLINILKSSKCNWMLSYYEFPELIEWLPKIDYKWRIKKYVKASGNIKNGNKRNYGNEVLITNYNCKNNIDNFFS